VAYLLPQSTDRNMATKISYNRVSVEYIYIIINYHPLPLPLPFTPSHSL